MRCSVSERLSNQNRKRNCVAVIQFVWCDLSALSDPKLVLRAGSLLWSMFTMLRNLPWLLGGMGNQIQIVMSVCWIPLDLCTFYKIWYHFSSTLNRGVRCSGHIYYVSALLSTPSKQFWDLKEEGTIFIIPGSNLSDVINNNTWLCSFVKVFPSCLVSAWRDLAEGQCARN